MPHLVHLSMLYYLHNMLFCTTVYYVGKVISKLITSLRTAVDNDGTLDNESTSYNDIFDAFRLALKFYQFQEA
jgi:hypothetical protein